MFHNEFYPTPRHVLDRMMIDCEGKVVYEPHAGKADIVKYCKEFGAKEVLASEINDDLRAITSKHARIIGSDFFKVTSEQISHANLIVMNPPFSNAKAHIMHAWQIAPEGCEIVALCNWDTLDNRWGSSELSALVRDYGNKEELGDCFSNAERKTNVNVGLIHLFKPVISERFDWDGFYFNSDEDPDRNGIMPYNDIRAIVNSYVAAVRKYDEVYEVSEAMNSITKGLGYGNSIKFIGSDNYRGRDSEVTKEVFAKNLQRYCWSRVFNKMQIEKLVTKGVKEDINAFIEHRLAYPFTMRNIYRMIEIIVGTADQTMDRAIVEIVDRVTKHTHENRYNLEGWKTNEGHLLGKKFIIDGVAEHSYTKGLLNVKYSGYYIDMLEDLFKALCFLTGTAYDDVKDSNDDVIRKGVTRSYNLKQIKPNTWHDWDFFEFKVFKKGTGHFKFKDLKVWELLNRRYASAKGQVLPEKI